MKPPSFNTYTNNWLGSSRVSAMLPEQEGAYFRLLCYQWNSEDQTITDADEDLARLGPRSLDAGPLLELPLQLRDAGPQQHERLVVLGALADRLHLLGVRDGGLGQEERRETGARLDVGVPRPAGLITEGPVAGALAAVLEVQPELAAPADEVGEGVVLTVVEGAADVLDTNGGGIRRERAPNPKASARDDA
jgi:hypothetical protein